MNLLLDTCAFIWLSVEPARLGPSARRAIGEADNELWISHASCWEIHLKHLSGKLRLPDPPRLWISRQLAEWQVRDRAVSLEALHLTSELPLIHKDPFDRLLAAQCLLEDLALISPDAFFPRYQVRLIW